MSSHHSGSFTEPAELLDSSFPCSTERSVLRQVRPRSFTSLRVDRILELADALEKGSTPVPGFDMAHFYTSSHSIRHNVNRIRDDRGGIIAGLEAHVVTFFSEVPVSTASVHGAAMQILGLDAGQAEALFRPSGLRPREITRETAVGALRRLAATGEVIWVQK